MKYYIAKNNKGQLCEIWVNDSGAWVKGEERANIEKTRRALAEIGGFDSKTLQRNTKIDGVLSYKINIQTLTLTSF